MVKALSKHIIPVKKFGERFTLAILSTITSQAMVFTILIIWSMKGSFKMIVFVARAGWLSHRISSTLGILKMEGNMVEEFRGEENK